MTPHLKSHLKSEISNLKSGISNLAVILTTVSCLLTPIFCPLPSAFALEPQSCAITNLRFEAEAFISDTEFFRGQTLLLTNNIAYSGSSTSSDRENLSNVTITVSVGLTTTNHSATGAVQVATNGTWWTSFVVPTNWVTPYLQVKLSSGSVTNIYPLKKIRTRSAL